MGSGKGKMILRLEPDPHETVLLKLERASEPPGARSTPWLPHLQGLAFPRAPGPENVRVWCILGMLWLWAECTWELLP